MAEKNKFWGASSSSESEAGSDDEAKVEAKATQRQMGGTHHFIIDSDTESEDEGRVVRSAKDKRWGEMRAAIKSLIHLLEINDWNGIAQDFDKLNRVLDKAKRVVAKEGIPRFYVRMVVMLEDQANKVTKAQTRKWNAQNARSFQRTRKEIRNNNKQPKLASAIEAFRKAPTDWTESEDSSSESDSSDSSSDDGGSASSGSKKSGSAGGSGSGSDEDDDDGFSDSGSGSDSDSDEFDSSSSGSDSDSDVGEFSKMTRDYWVKKDAVVKAKKTKTKTQTDSKKDESAQEAAPKAVAVAQQEWTPEVLTQEMIGIVRARGRKNISRKRLIGDLRNLFARAMEFNATFQLPVLMQLISSQFDISSRSIDAYLPRRLWVKVLVDINTVLSILEANPKLRLVPMSTEAIAGTTDGDEAKLEANAAAVSEAVKAGHTPVAVVGDLCMFVTMLGEEYMRALQKTDAHSANYVARIRDEQQLSLLSNKVFKYFERVGDTAKCGTLALLRLEHMYYKHDAITQSLHQQQPNIPTLFEFIAQRKAEVAARKAAAAAEAAANGEAAPAAEAGAAAGVGGGAGAGAGAGAGTQAAAPGAEGEKAIRTVAQVQQEILELDLDEQQYVITRLAADPDAPKLDVRKEIEGLCNFIFDNSDERARARAMLCLIYYHAAHDRFHEARDLLLVSHLQDHIQHMDEGTQILYNRMMAQLGLCAYRMGLFEACQTCLHELTGIGRPKELLAQGLSNQRFQDRDAEREKTERRRQVPYHMHINLELLEACHLISAMLLEVPNMAAEEHDPNRRRISNTFRKQLDIVSSKTFVGPPETTRDTVITAALALGACDWRKASEFLMALPVWKLWSGSHYDLAKVHAQLVEQLKIVALRTFMLTYAAHYDAISHDHLCEQFELPRNTVHAATSKMMIEEDLPAAWDQPTSTIVMQKVEPTRLQSLALDFADKVAVFVETNERLLSARTGGQYGDDGRNNRWGGRRRGGGGGGRNFGYYSKRGRGRARRFGERAGNNNSRQSYDQRYGRR